MLKGGILLQDRDIITLFNERNEAAIRESELKFGPYCYEIAYRILLSAQDAEEAENDAFLKAWNRIPPDAPLPLLPYFGMLTRQSAIDRRRADTAKKRGGGEYELTLSELEGCVSCESGETLPDSLALREALGVFLRGLSKDKRIIFLRRYFYLSTIREIAEDFALSESKVKMILLRTREKLRDFLKKEGLFE